MTKPLTIECQLQVERRGRGGRKILRLGSSQERTSTPRGRLPRVTRLMALAIRFERLLAEGHVTTYAELARLSHVSRARLTQIMNLRLLATDIQEELLSLPRIERGRDPVVLRDLQPITLEPDWTIQRQLWRVVMA